MRISRCRDLELRLMSSFSSVWVCRCAVKPLIDAGQCNLVLIRGGAKTANSSVRQQWVAGLVDAVDADSLDADAYPLAAVSPHRPDGRGGHPEGPGEEVANGLVGFAFGGLLPDRDLQC